jgi:phospholipid/cholesterol/gamma-HCH transport system permease protein
MHGFILMQRIERWRIFGAAGGAAYIDAAYRALFAQNGGASGDRIEVGNVAYANAWNIRKSLHWLYGSIGKRGPTCLLDFLKEPILSAQDFFILTGKALRNIFLKPHYADDVILQMDDIGVGSLQIVFMTGFFSGAVMALQMSRALAQYGQVGKTGSLVSVTLVRELGPVLTAIMVAGRNSSGIASELGSMKVTEQIDAMRALGTDPVQKLVTPRVIATCVMLPLLVVIADFVGLVGGWCIAYLFLSLTFQQYWSSAWQVLGWSDVGQGLLKPLVFALVVSLIGCFYGLRTTGGTQGVGRATTQAVVMAIVLIFILDLLITKIFVFQGGS